MTDGTTTQDKLQAAARKRLERPGEHERLAGICREIGQRDDVRERRSANAKAQWADPEARRQRSEEFAKRWADPVFKAEVLAKRRATRDAKRAVPKDDPGEPAI